MVCSTSVHHTIYFFGFFIFIGCSSPKYNWAHPDWVLQLGCEIPLLHGGETLAKMRTGDMHAVHVLSFLNIGEFWVHGCRCSHISIWLDV